MRFVLLGLAAIGLAACDDGPQTSELERDDCFTVNVYNNLFNSAEIIPPAANVPASLRAFSGTWGQGAWDGGQCHEIHVTQIFPDGRAIVMDTQAPYGEELASAYQFPARIANGRLVIDRSDSRREYVLRDGRLYGTRVDPGQRPKRIILRRQL